MNPKEIPVEAYASIMLGYFLASPIRNEEGAYLASQTLAGVRDEPKCPAPRKNRLLVTAATPLKCDEPATVLTAVPMRDRNGKLVLVSQKQCLEHSIESACWKLIYAILEHDRQNPQRVIAA